MKDVCVWPPTFAMIERMEDLDPTRLSGACPFYGYTIDDSGTQFAVWVQSSSGLRLFVAEEIDAVHVVLVLKPQAPPGARDADHQSYVGPPRCITGHLSKPLGHRPIIDETRGDPVRRLTPPVELAPDESIHPTDLAALRARTERVRRRLRDAAA